MLGFEAGHRLFANAREMLSFADDATDRLRDEWTGLRGHRRVFATIDPGQSAGGDVEPKERIWVGPVPITSVSRTLNDLARSGLSPELLRQAAQQALRRGLTTRGELAEDLLRATRSLCSFEDRQQQSPPGSPIGRLRLGM